MIFLLNCKQWTVFTQPHETMMILMITCCSGALLDVYEFHTQSAQTVTPESPRVITFLRDKLAGLAFQIAVIPPVCFFLRDCSSFCSFSDPGLQLRWFVLKLLKSVSVFECLSTFGFKPYSQRHFCLVVLSFCLVVISIYKLRFA